MRAPLGGLATALLALGVLPVPEPFDAFDAEEVIHDLLQCGIDPHELAQLVPIEKFVESARTCIATQRLLRDSGQRENRASRLLDIAAQLSGKTVVQQTRPVLEVGPGGARARYIETAPSPELRTLPRREKKVRTAEQRAEQREAKRARGRSKKARGW